MKKYRISLTKNLKCGFLTLPFGLVTLFADFMIISSGFVSWKTVVFFIVINLIGLPGILIHLYYLLHDLRLEIIYNTSNNYFDFVNNGKSTRIFKDEIEYIDKITKDRLFGRIPWWTYKIFQIKLKKGAVFPMTNLTIDFDELYEMVKTENKQLKINCKFRLL